MLRMDYKYNGTAATNATNYDALFGIELEKMNGADELRVKRLYWARIEYESL